MNAAVFSVLLAAASTMPIHGGSPWERRVVREALAQVPACLRDVPGVAVKVKIMPSDEDNAFFDFDEETVEINAAAIPGTARYEAALKDDAAYACTSVRRMRRFENLDATLLHEFTHHYHFDGVHPLSNGEEEPNTHFLEQFLSLKFRPSRAKALHDWKVRTLSRKLDTLDTVDPWTDEQQARFCRWQDELDRRVATWGFPVRYPGDGPYTLADGSGGEYFAEAVETFAFYPDVFCRAYSDAERRWLVEHLGTCLGKIAPPPSCGGQVTPARPGRRTVHGK